MGIVNVVEYIRQLYLRTQKNELTAMGAQLSYYLIISIFPFLIFLLTLLKYTPLAQENTLQQLSLILPETIYSVILQIAEEISSTNNFTLLSFGFIGTIWAASRGTSAIIRSLNKAYEAQESRSFLKINSVGILSTLALAMVIIFSLALLVFGKILGAIIFKHLGLENVFESLWWYLRYLIPVVIIFIVFSLLYLYSPNVPLGFRDVYPGAIFSTLGWLSASQLFSYYVNNFGHFSLTYGSLGGIIIFLVWLYMSSVIILLGGEINATSLHLFGSSRPADTFIPK